MQNNTSLNLPFYLKKYWFQLSMIALVLYVLIGKDFSFQFNINDPNIEKAIDHPNQKPKKKDKELLTKANQTTPVAKSEASFFSKIPFIGGGSNSVEKKSELPQVDASVVESYLQRFANVAISERKKYGVPASITLANALFHTYAGNRDMAQAGNNHFAIACSSDWNGPSATYGGMCYRHYENAWTSFRDHSLFVTSGKYSNLRQLESTDYKAWAKNLEAQGFSEFDDLEKNLIELIDKYGLHQLDFK